MKFQKGHITMDNLYEIIFIDGTKFCGGNLQDTKWMQMPDKSIKKLTYRLPSGEKIDCEGYNAYYHFVEVCQDIMNGNQGKVQLEYAYLITKDGPMCEVIKVNLRTNKFEQIVLDESSDFIRQLNPIGWKEGI